MSSEKPLSKSIVPPKSPMNQSLVIIILYYIILVIVKSQCGYMGEMTHIERASFQNRARPWHQHGTSPDHRSPFTPVPFSGLTLQQAAML